MKKVFRFFASTKFILILSLLINIATFVLISYFLDSFFYGLISLLILIICCISLWKSRIQPIYKIMWALFIYIMPIFGCVLYSRANHSYGSIKNRKAWQNITFLSSNYLPSNTKCYEDLNKFDPTSFKQSMYISNTITMPVYENTSTKFLADGTAYFKEMFELIKKAKRYIFLEYFIFKQGRIWDELFLLLKEKAREGVEIKILYDDFGCMDRFEDRKTFKKLANYKIEALPFNRVLSSFSGFINYRDHRKILIVDGEYAMTGGINIGDEYCNLVEAYGTWKDNGISMTGEGVWSLVVMFINSWHFSSNERLDYEKYKSTTSTKVKSKEWVQPYGTSPLTYEPVARNIYLNLINSAQKSIYISSPYMILDEELITALKLAAKSGVLVSIIFPAIPDKKTAFYLARSRFTELIKAGIKINEFSGGFVHAKNVIIDGKIASIGTVNMDFRSLYLHFENGVLLYNSPTVSEMNNDFEKTLALSHQLTLKDMKKRKFVEKFCGFFLKILSPFF